MKLGYTAGTLDTGQLPQEDKPIAKHRLHGLRHFLGLFAGEHVAGTEFVIGATFVLWGVSAADVLLGLIFGNLLAVLTWTFICAPIATDTRLTLYSYLKKIAGPSMQKVYNAVNGVLYCVLGGAMITVAASAVRILFGIPVQTQWYPTSASFIFLVLIIGSIVAIVAAMGFKSVAQFSSICAPWLLLMFISGAVVMLPELVAMSGTVSGLHSVSDFLQLANAHIWTGQPMGGGEEMGMLHVMAFAWIANLAMHGGLSDMAIFRFAKSYRYGYASAVGVFFGHYIAWICAGIMGAAAAMVLNTSIAQLDSGEVAYQALGAVGILAVIIAGWTTSNPTLYRAGLAFQTIFHRYSVRRVTAITGAVTTVIACFPFVFTKLLDFVGYMGLILVPVGTIVFTEHWIFPKIGYTRYWAQYKGLRLNVPALASWMIGVAFAVCMDTFGIIHLYFLFVPTWVVTMVAYLILAGLGGAREQYPEAEREEKQRQEQIRQEQAIEAEGISPHPGSQISSTRIKVAGASALLAILALLGMAGAVFAGMMELDEYKALALVPSLIYFVSATIWIGKKEQSKESVSSRTPSL
ncbi:purine-cytosine permease family protein [Desmospora activa]|uniref:NCS1 family nucleobase:cation symporter-1 n=1 Tax=Desmospora activa DSM 45169 TaxID=1121389 RepID=A0A2T4Z0N7_9BACL|nr:nucleoside transporter [Desmospora activa]PTM53293.1 NCS1 family nucleobase:cation symporter-1 [Desmospora activa DSM 45169]